MGNSLSSALSCIARDIIPFPCYKAGVWRKLKICKNGAKEQLEDVKGQRPCRIL